MLRPRKHWAWSIRLPTPTVAGKNVESSKGVPGKNATARKYNFKIEISFFFKVFTFSFDKVVTFGGEKWYLFRKIRVDLFLKWCPVT